MASRSALEGRHRKSARVALYSSLIITGALAAVMVQTLGSALNRSRLYEAGIQDWAYVDWAQEPAVRILQDYLRVDTNSRDGSELEGARYLAGVLEEAGIEVHLEALGEKNANLWAILEGQEPGAVVLHNHIDVEPIHRPDRWTYPPFAGHIDPPWIYGRGVFDMKSLAVAQLMAMLDLKKEGITPRKSLIFLATGSEEIGSDLGALWVLRQHPDLVERFDVVLTEGGVVEALDKDQVKYWGTSFAQKQYAELIVCSSRARELAEIRQMIRDYQLWKPELPIVTDEARTMFASYYPTRSREDYRSKLQDPDALLVDNRSFKSLPEYLRAMLRNEAYPGRVRRTESGFEMIINIHVLPGLDIETVRRELVPDWMLWGVDWRLFREPAADHGSPVDHAAFKAIIEGIQRRYPEATVGPYFLPRTATDARFYRRLGIPSYGVSPFLILTPDTMTGNNPDERIALPAYADGVEMYSQLVEELVR